MVGSPALTVGSTYFFSCWLLVVSFWIRWVSVSRVSLPVSWWLSVVPLNITPSRTRLRWKESFSDGKRKWWWPPSDTRSSVSAWRPPVSRYLRLSYGGSREKRWRWLWAWRWLRLVWVRPWLYLSRFPPPSTSVVSPLLSCFVFVCCVSVWSPSSYFAWWIASWTLRWTLSSKPRRKSLSVWKISYWSLPIRVSGWSLCFAYYSIRPYSPSWNTLRTWWSINIT